ncbi:hypothetical protein [Novosphingobium indicum]|nr:hypothetical protein [Novosphingobium indicum]
MAPSLTGYGLSPFAHGLSRRRIATLMPELFGEDLRSFSSQLGGSARTG